MKVFEKPTENLECTPKSKSSIAVKLYQCIDRSGIPVNCKRTQSTIPGIRLTASCSVTIDEENVLQTFYCIEHMFDDPAGRLSTHYNITFVPSKSQTCKNGKMVKF